jgi:hypothetical protein
MIHLMLAKAQDADTNATPQYIQPHLSGPQGKALFTIIPSNPIRRCAW